MDRFRLAALLMVTAMAPVHAQAGGATATLSDSGIVVRFPRSVSPDSITREMLVGDFFSGYEWRIILVGRTDNVLLSAFVIPPDDNLTIHRYIDIKDAYFAGDLRSCQRTDLVLQCGRPARGLVRDVKGQLEIAIIDTRWLSLAVQSAAPKILLVVKRGREDLWSAEVPLVGRLH